MPNTFDVGILQLSEIEALLDLQRANLAINLDAETIDSQGFVTFVYSVEAIQKMMQQAPQIVARADGNIIGYALATTIESGLENELIRPLVELTKKLGPLSKKPFYFMGQVCVRAGYRGIGVFDALYQEHKDLFRYQYKAVVTEIASDNLRSIAAHRRVGFETLHTEFDEKHGKEWQVVAWFF
jgi:ribosomal protein S18 acetylase RimI-like enzyme